MNEKFRLQRSTDKYQKKIKYLIDRYKVAKDWNSNQSGGYRRKSIFFDKIDEVLGCRDVVTLHHVANVGASVSTSTSSNSEETAENPTNKMRTERKKSRKMARAEEHDDEKREMIKASLDGLTEQHQDMSKFRDNFSRMQEQQAQTMNTLVGALTSFLQNNNNKN